MKKQSSCRWKTPIDPNGAKETKANGSYLKIVATNKSKEYSKGVEARPSCFDYSRGGEPHGSYGARTYGQGDKQDKRTVPVSRVSRAKICWCLLI